MCASALAAVQSWIWGQRDKKDCSTYHSTDDFFMLKAENNVLEQPYDYYVWSIMPRMKSDADKRRGERQMQRRTHKTGLFKGGVPSLDDLICGGH